MEANNVKWIEILYKNGFVLARLIATEVDSLFDPIQCNKSVQP